MKERRLPKSEGRNPKAEPAPGRFDKDFKTEVYSSHNRPDAFSVFETKGPKSFGIRLSAFLRPSVFGLRIYAPASTASREVLS